MSTPEHPDPRENAYRDLDTRADTALTQLEHLAERAAVFNRSFAFYAEHPDAEHDYAYEAAKLAWQALQDDIARAKAALAQIDAERAALDQAGE